MILVVKGYTVDDFLIPLFAKCIDTSTYGYSTSGLTPTSSKGGHVSLRRLGLLSLIEKKLKTEGGKYCPKIICQYSYALKNWY